jgi:hypothetical protein
VLILLAVVGLSLLVMPPAEAEPERFAVQMGGGCGRMGPLSGSCSPERFAVHDGRIDIFASDAWGATTTLDGQRDESLSGPVDALEVDPVMGEELFARRG